MITVLKRLIEIESELYAATAQATLFNYSDEVHRKLILITKAVIHVKGIVDKEMNGREEKEAKEKEKEIQKASDRLGVARTRKES